jgi:hypothetical protein
MRCRRRFAGANLADQQDVRRTSANVRRRDLAFGGASVISTPSAPGVCEESSRYVGLECGLPAPTGILS